MSIFSAVHVRTGRCGINTDAVRALVLVAVHVDRSLAGLARPAGLAAAAA